MTHTSGHQTVIDAATAAELLAPLSDIVAAAAAAVRAIDRSTVKATDKADGSPLTMADLAADRIIAAGLARLRPDLPVISEERIEDAASADPVSFFIVDPIDGTKEFINGFDDYTINLALVSNGRPLLGIVCAPAMGLLWRGVPGRGAERLTMATDGTALGPPTAIRTRHCPATGWVAAVSRSHCDSRTEAYLDSRPGGRREPVGSALKFCRLAEGAADIYPRLSPISEWDIAAGHAVLEAAGGNITDAKGQPLRFGGNPKDIIIREFIAWGDPAITPLP